MLTPEEESGLEKLKEYQARTLLTINDISNSERMKKELQSIYDVRQKRIDDMDKRKNSPPSL